MDPNLYLLPRMKTESDSGKEVGTDESQSLHDEELHEAVLQVKNSLSLLQSQYPPSDPRFEPLLSQLIRDSLASLPFLLSRSLFLPAHQLLQLLVHSLRALPPTRLPALRCDLYNSLSYVSRKWNKPSLAHKFALKSLSILENSDSVEIDRAGTHSNICGLLSALGRYKEAVEHAKKAVETLQEDLVTMKLTHRTERLGEKVRGLVIGYQNVAAGIDAMGRYSEAAVWYGKAVRLATESGDMEIRTMLPTLQSALSLAKSRVGNRGKTHIGVERTSPREGYCSTPGPYITNPEASGESQSTSFRISTQQPRPIEYKASAQSEFSSSSYYKSEDSVSGVGPYFQSDCSVTNERILVDNILSNEEEDLRTLSSMGVMDFDEEEVKHPMLRTLSDAKHMKRQPISSMKLNLAVDAVESSPQMRTFLWKRDTTESERSDFQMNSLQRGIEKLPKLLKTTEKRFNSSGKRSYSPSTYGKSSLKSSDNEGKPKSPLRLRRFRPSDTSKSSNSAGSGKSDGKYAPMLRKKDTKTTFQGKSIVISAFLIRKAVKIIKIMKVSKRNETNSTVANGTANEIEAAKRIQTAFRRFKAKNRLKMLKKVVKNRENRRIVLRIGTKFESEMGILSVYEGKSGKIELIAIVKGEEFTLNMQNSRNFDIKSIIPRLILGENHKLAIKSDICEVKTTLLDEFSLFYLKYRYKVSIIRTEMTISIDCTPENTPNSIDISGNSYSDKEFNPIFPDNLPLCIEIVENAVKIRKFPPIFTHKRTLFPDFLSDFRIYTHRTALEVQITLLNRSIMLFYLSESDLLPIFPSISRFSDSEYNQIIDFFSLGPSGLVQFRLKSNPSPMEHDSALIIQKYIRRFLAKQRISFLRRHKPPISAPTVIFRKAILLSNCYLFLLVISQPSNGVVISAVEQMSKRESKLKIGQLAWKELGESEEKAVSALIQALSYRNGSLFLLSQPENRPISTRKLSKATAAVEIQRRIRGFLARFQYNQLTKGRKSVLKLCRYTEFAGESYYVAIYSSDSELTAELFITVKFDREKHRSKVVKLPFDELVGIYGSIPSFDTVFADIRYESGLLSLSPAPNRSKSYQSDPVFLVSTIKAHLNSPVSISVYLHEDYSSQFLEFITESDPPIRTQASLDQLYTHCRLPRDQTLIVALATVRYMLEFRGDGLVLSFLRPIPDLIAAITKTQAYVRGFLARQRLPMGVKFNAYGLVTCSKRVLSRLNYAIYAYYKDSQYKLEAVSKCPRTRLKVFLDAGMFKRFGPKIDRKRVFDEIVFPRLTIITKDDCARLSIEPISNVLQGDISRFVRKTTEIKPVSPILRRKMRKTDIKRPVPPVEWQSENDSRSISVSTLRKPADEASSDPLPSLDSSRPRFSAISQPITTRISPEPTPRHAHFTIFPRELTLSDLSAREPVPIPTIHQVPGIDISPEKRSQSPSLVLQSIQQSVIPPTRSEIVLRLHSEDSDNQGGGNSLVAERQYQSSEPRSPASQPRSPKSSHRYSENDRLTVESGYLLAENGTVLIQGGGDRPSSSVRYGDQGEDIEGVMGGRELVTRVGMDFTAGFCMVSMYVQGGRVEVEATSVETGEKATMMSTVSSSDFEVIDAMCSSLLSSLDVIRGEEGLVLLQHGQRVGSQQVFAGRQEIGGRTFAVTISSEQSSLFIRAFDESQHTTLELILSNRSRRVDTILPSELQALISRLKVQVVLGKEVLLLELA